MHIGCCFYYRNETDCQSCTPGSYCDGNGLSVPKGLCMRGYYCSGHAEKDTQHQCEVGHYCLTGSHNKRSCPSGEYQNEPGQWQCKVCPKGMQKVNFVLFTQIIILVQN